jgi:hypothetical protein
MNSFTLEASFAGASVGKLKGLQFNTSHYESMGRSLCQTLWPYLNPDLHEQARQSILAMAPNATASDGGGLDSSDDSSSSPDEVGLPLTVGRAAAEKERLWRKQQQQLGGGGKAKKKKMGAMAMQAGLAGASAATAGSPNSLTNKTADGSPLSSSPTSSAKSKFSRAPAQAREASAPREIAFQTMTTARKSFSGASSSNTAAAVGGGDPRKDRRRSQVWNQQSDDAAEQEAARRKKRTAAAAAARREIRELSGTNFAPVSNVSAAGSIGFGISGYYRNAASSAVNANTAPSVNSSPDLVGRSVPTTVPQRMILDEEDERRSGIGSNNAASGSDSSPVHSRQVSASWDPSSSLSAAIRTISVASTIRARPKSAYPVSTVSASREVLSIESSRTRGAMTSAAAGGVGSEGLTERGVGGRRPETAAAARRASMNTANGRGGTQYESSLAQVAANTSHAVPSQDQQTSRRREAHARAAQAASILAASTPTNLYSSNASYCPPAQIVSSVSPASATFTLSSSTAPVLSSATAEEIYNRSRAPDPLLQRGERPQRETVRDAEQERIDRLLAMTGPMASGGYPAPSSMHQAGAWYGSASTHAVQKSRPPAANGWTRSSGTHSGVGSQPRAGQTGNASLSNGLLSIAGMSASSATITHGQRRRPAWIPDGKRRGHKLWSSK